MECLFPKKGKRGREEKLVRRMKEHKKIQCEIKCDLDELEDYYHYEEYKKRFKLLFEFFSQKNH